MSVFDAVFKSARPRAVAAVSRFAGDLAMAEDAVHEAMLRALSRWPDTGVPDSPEAWLIVTARRWLIDRSRQRSHQASYRRLVAPLAAATADEPDLSGLDDDLLRLVFTCCHPALAEDARVALTLNVILGLSSADVAQAFLTTRRTMEQRLTRARRKLREAGVGFRLPRDDERAERLTSVLAVIYLVFNQGYSPRQRDELVGVDLCAEAIWLARLLDRLHRGEPELQGLLALMLFQHSRHGARCDAGGELVLLGDQDRRLWDRDLIAEGRALLHLALRKRCPGAYQTQAAIAALHCEAPTASDTDWPQIAGLYAVLERQAPGPVVTLNRAVAVAHAEGPEQALSLLRPLAALAPMQRYSPYYAALAEISWMAGDGAGARRAWTAAARHTDSPQELAHYRRRLAATRPPPGKR